MRYRDDDGESLCGVLYLRLEDFLSTPSSVMCIPMEPQGILLAEISYEDPKTEIRQPKLKRNRKLFKGTCTCIICNLGRFYDGGVYIHVYHICSNYTREPYNQLMIANMLTCCCVARQPF